MLAQSYEASGDDERAFKEYQKLLRYYPQNVDYEEVQKRQMLIADRFLGGQRFKLWGKIPLYRSWKKSAQMYQEVVNVGPQSEVAPMAQMKVGEASLPHLHLRHRSHLALWTNIHDFLIHLRRLFPGTVQGDLPP